MRIRRIETFCNQFVGFVRVTTEDGAAGWGRYRRITTSPCRVDNGCITVSDAPGGDVEISEEWLRSAAYQVSESS